MNYYFIILLCLISLRSPAQEVRVFDFDELEAEYIKGGSDSLYIINFWATWCKPCVAELPYFEAAKEHFTDKPVRFLLVSLDFKDEVESKLKPFITKNNLQTEVVLLDDPNENDWIPKVDEQWQGAIPATLMVQPSTEKRYFYGQSFEKEKLISIIENNLKQCKE